VGAIGRMWERSPLRFTSTHLCFSFFLSFFFLHLFLFHIFKNASDMNSVDSLRKMFDRTAGYKASQGLFERDQYASWVMRPGGVEVWFGLVW
jgi:hypothetical protein